MDNWDMKSLSQLKTLPPSISRGSQIWKGKPGIMWHRLSSWAFYPGSRVGYVEDMVLSHWRFSLLQVMPLSPPRNLQGCGDPDLVMLLLVPGLLVPLSASWPSLMPVQMDTLSRKKKKKRCLDSMIKLHFCKNIGDLPSPQITFMLAISLSVPVSFPKPFNHCPLSLQSPLHAHLYPFPSLIAWW